MQTIKNVRSSKEKSTQIAKEVSSISYNIIESSSPASICSGLTNSSCDDSQSEGWSQDDSSLVERRRVLLQTEQQTRVVECRANKNRQKHSLHRTQSESSLGNRRTTPKALPPRFNEYIIREIPKSTEEKEMELMEFYAANPIRAKPILYPALQKIFNDEKAASPILPKPVTRPEPFHLRCEERAAARETENYNTHCRRNSNGTLFPRLTKTADVETFFSSQLRSDYHAHTNKRLGPTAPQPFHFRIEERLKQRSNERVTTGDERTKEQVTPKLVAHTRKAAPFKLATDSRHEKHQKELEEKLKHEDEERKKQARFRAREFNSSIFLNQHDTPKYLRRNNHRHNHKKQLEQMLKQEEEERRKRATFRAREFNAQMFEHHGDNYLRKNTHRHNQKYIQSLAEDIDGAEKLRRVLERYKANNIGAFHFETSKRHDEYQKKQAERTKNFERDVKKETVDRCMTGNPNTNPDEADESSPGVSTSSADMESTVRFKQNASSVRKRKNKNISSSNQLSNPKTSEKPAISKEAEDDSREGKLKYGTKNPFHSGSGEATETDSQSPKAINIKVFLLICIFRVLNTFLVRSYFDPDEFWQTMEPAYCSVFVNDRPCPGFTWEWKRRAPDTASNLIDRSMLGPARAYLSVVPVHMYYWILKTLNMDTYWLVSRGPMVLYALTVAAPIDMAVWYTARWLKPPNGYTNRTILPAWCLFCSLSSWFNGYTLVRTFANGQEALFCILAIALVSPELIGDVDQRYGFLRACTAFLLGGLSMVIRFTAVAAFVPMGIILALRCRTNASKIGFLFVPCALFGLLGIGIGMIVDLLFYGFWTIPFLGNFHFNVVLNFAGLYGTHPIHWYFTAGLPAITGLLLPFSIYDLLRLNGQDSGRRNLWIIVLTYLFVMSFNAHKEFRYILPILPIICLLTATRVRAVFVWHANSRLYFHTIGALFFIPNLIAVLYLGLVHQAGPISVNREIVSIARSVNSGDSSRINFAVHYLTGGCHSAPLLSSLHSPPLTFYNDIWHLDCSPDCRSDPERTCEFENCATDPVSFLNDNYFPCENISSRKERKSCLSSPKRSLPDFMVTFADSAEKLRSILAEEGLHEVARYPQNINGIRVGNEFVVGNEDNFFKNTAFRKFEVIPGFLDITMDEIVLFSKLGPTSKK